MDPDPTSAPHRGLDGGLPIDLPIFLGRRRALGLLGGDPAHGSNDANVLDATTALRINSARFSGTGRPNPIQLPGNALNGSAS